MILIADSGSTKTDWRWVTTDQATSAIQTIGLNPVLMNKGLIIKELTPVFLDQESNKTVQGIFFYGAGCWDEKSCSIMERALATIFPNAKISVASDLFGAARAVCGTNAGIACILGTGANSCLFDGEKVIDNIPALGYIVGDEGSGAYLGKQLLKQYFYRELPERLSAKLLKEYSISKQQMIEVVYRGAQGNRYLASFAKFIIQEKEDPFIKNLISDAFDKFIKRQILKYDNAAQLPIHFIGSIAYFLKEHLQEQLTQNKVQLGKVIRQPIDGLTEFHKQIKWQKNKKTSKE